MNYQDHFNESIADPARFWQRQAGKISWYRPPSSTLRESHLSGWEWFTGGILNTCYLALDVHCEQGRAAQSALIYDSPVTGVCRTYSYGELRDLVARFAGGLRSLGVERGDRVIIYMPMIPEAVIAMLACARLGAIHSVVFGGFAPAELAIRIDDAKPKTIITASSGIEVSKRIDYKPLVDAAIELAKHQPEHVVIHHRKLGARVKVTQRDRSFSELMAYPPTECVPVESTDPLYILYTSGTTGTPKGVVRDNGGHAVALNYSMENIYKVNIGDVFWAASDIGWVVGHSYIVYAPLIRGATTVLFEGKPVKTPDSHTFWRVIEQHKVNVMFTAPTAIRAIRREDPNGVGISAHDLSSLRTQFLAGERCDVSTLDWLSQKLSIPVIDHWWQTESGWPMVANFAGDGSRPIKPGSVSLPVPGYDLRILDQKGDEVPANTEGYVAIALPLPPGCANTLWSNHERFKAGYLERFPGFYFSGDGGYRDEDGYVFITGRVDDVINVAGHRLSTAEMEEVVAGHSLVAECAVVGMKCELKGEVPVALVVLRHSTTSIESQVLEEVVQRVRAEIGPIAALKTVISVARLPKTRSGKTLRKLIRGLLNNEQVKVPSTIDDPEIIHEFKEALSLKLTP